VTNVVLFLKIVYWSYRGSSYVVANAVNLTLNLAIDNAGVAYLDGSQPVNNSDFSTPSSGVMTGTTASLLAITFYNAGGLGGFIISTNTRNCITDSPGWRCTNTNVSYSNWKQATFDDSAWPLAVPYRNNCASSCSSPYPILTAMSTSCPWIGLANPNTFGNIYCRLSLRNL
jgi:hypothetical protein